MTWTPPWNEDAERAVLGAVLCRNELFEDASLEPQDFFHPRHREAWRGLGLLRAERLDANPVSVADKLEQGLSDPVGLVFLSDLSSCGVTDRGYVAQMAALIRRDAFAREVHVSLGEALSGGLEGEDLLADVVARTNALHSKSQRDERFALQPDILRRVFADLEARVDGTSKAQTIATGIYDLDAVIGGLKPGVLSLIGGRTSMGKSALARTIAYNASSAGHGTHFFSLEDSGETLVTRQLSDVSGVELERFHVPKRMDRHDISRIAIAHETLRQASKWGIEDTPTMSSAQIAMSVRRRKRELETRLVVVDYAQLVSEKAPSPRERINLAVEGLFRLARTEGVAVLLVSQVNRANDKEQRKPRLSDLKESGSLEEQAYVVLLVHRGEDDDGREEAGVNVAKNKNGRTGWVPLKWDAPTATYRSKTF